MACDYRWLMSRDPDYSFIQQYGIVDIDWSNAKEMWINEHINDTMGCEESMKEQARLVKQGDPTKKTMVYRNTAIAYPWMSTVSKILNDPTGAYDAWFIRFKNGSDGLGPLHHDGDGTYTQPVCDHAWTPPRCSPLYHSQTQTPEYPFAKGSGGNCAAPCDCGKVPCGFYLFDQRMWNHSIRGQTLGEWMVDELIVGGLRDPDIDAYYIDDSWSSSSITDIGHSAFLDCNLSLADGKAMTAAWEHNQMIVQEAILAHGGFQWQMMINSGIGGGRIPGPPVTNSTCETVLRAATNSTNIFQRGALFYPLAPGGWTPGVIDPAIIENVASFLIMRGDYAWMGFAWQGCANTTGSPFRPLPAEVKVDHGVPLGLATEVAPGVFEREWSKATARMDCNTFKGSVVMKNGG